MIKTDAIRRKRTTSRRAPRDRALTALVGGATITEAARQAKVQRQTVSNWLNNDEEFRASYKASVNKIRHQVEDKIGAGSARAVEVLLELFEHEDPRIRLMAASKVLDLHRRLPPPVEASNSEAKSMTIMELIESFQDKMKNGLGGGLG